MVMIMTNQIDIKKVEFIQENIHKLEELDSEIQKGVLKNGAMYTMSAPGNKNHFSFGELHVSSLKSLKGMCAEVRAVPGVKKALDFIWPELEKGPCDPSHRAERIREALAAFFHDGGVPGFHLLAFFSTLQECYRYHSDYVWNFLTSEKEVPYKSAV